MNNRDELKLFIFATVAIIAIVVAVYIYGMCLLSTVIMLISIYIITVLVSKKLFLHKIQMFLPMQTLPQRTNLDIFVVNKPIAGLGGDFYETFIMPDGKICVILGDMEGHCEKTYIRSMFSKKLIAGFVNNFQDPAMAMTYSNKAFSGIYGWTSTAVIAIIDMKNETIEYSIAGHPPPVKIMESGDVIFLQNYSPPLGAYNGYKYSAKTERFAAGDRLIILTDGITEARNDKTKVLFEQIGIERFIKSNHTLESKDIPSALARAAIRWADGKMKDDYLIMVLENKA